MCADAFEVSMLTVFGWDFFKLKNNTPQLFTPNKKIKLGNDAAWIKVRELDWLLPNFPLVVMVGDTSLSLEALSGCYFFPLIVIQTEATQIYILVFFFFLLW